MFAASRAATTNATAGQGDRMEPNAVTISQTLEPGFSIIRRAGRNQRFHDGSGFCYSAFSVAFGYI
jgi:hypothetical protein